MITVEALTAQHTPAWDAYVRSRPAGLPQHLSGWCTVLHNVYGYATHYLLARCPPEGSNTAAPAPIVGVLPLFFVPSWLTGRTLMTMPGGLCADSPAVAAALIAQGRDLAQECKADRFVIQDSRQRWPGELQTTEAHVHWVVELGNDEEALWQRLHRNLRRQVRIGRKEQLRVAIARTPELVADFYNVLSRFTHQVGTPFFGRNFLDEVVTHFPTGYNIVVVYRGAEPIGGYFQLEMGQTVYGLWGGALHDYLALRPVHLAYWSMLADALAHNFAFLDMGRSPLDSTASAFKGEWGGVASPIYQQVAAVGQAAKTTSAVTQAHEDGRFRTFRRVWPKLPLPVVQLLGPKLRRHIPFA
ncbi:MAG: GNAT family N-acetyltransferase [Caldilineaceae bacterium]